MAKRGRKTTASAYDIEHLKKYAREGAHAALIKLREEIAIIERTFPEFSTTEGRTKVAKTIAKSAKKSAQSWSDASRKAVSSRMKKYWAARKAASAAEGSGTGTRRKGPKKSAKK